jgi:hypothetical protein
MTSRQTRLRARSPPVASRNRPVGECWLRSAVQRLTGVAYSLDQGGQLGQAGHRGQRRGADRGDRIGEQPDVGVVADHLAEAIEYLAAQAHRVERFRGDGRNPLAGSGSRPAAAHPPSVRAVREPPAIWDIALPARRHSVTVR